MPIVCYKFWLVWKELEGQNSQIFFSKFLPSIQITVNIININIIYVLVDIRIYHRYNPGKSQENLHRMEGLNSVNIFTHYPACLPSPKSLKTVAVALT
jgi:hypothetical protein